jgi:hypothetical protein
MKTSARHSYEKLKPRTTTFTFKAFYVGRPSQVAEFKFRPEHWKLFFFTWVLPGSSSKMPGYYLIPRRTVGTFNSSHGAELGALYGIREYCSFETSPSWAVVCVQIQASLKDSVKLRPLSSTSLPTH